MPTFEINRAAIVYFKKNKFRLFDLAETASDIVSRHESGKIDTRRTASELLRQAVSNLKSPGYGMLIQISTQFGKIARGNIRPRDRVISNSINCHVSLGRH